MAETKVPDLPFRAEYAKSGRASCKICKNPIEKGELRLAAMVQSPFFDGKMPLWHHGHCFHLKYKPQSVGDVAHFDSLRWDDQENIRKKIGAGGPSSSSAGGESSSGKVGNTKTKDLVKEFKVEYAKSGASTCIACDAKIPKAEMRIGKKDYESETALKYGALDRWHHVDCFVKVRMPLQFFEVGSKIPGFKDLDKEDQQTIKIKLPIIASGKRKIEENGDVKPNKMAKTETVPKEDKGKQKEEKLAREQNKKMFAFRDKLEGHFAKKDLIALLEYNKQEVPAGTDRILDRLADIMTFGALLPCKVCEGGQYVYRSGIGYQCMGDLTEYTKCAVISNNPTRVVFKVPKDYRDNFKTTEFKIGTRVIPTNAVTPSRSQTKFVKLNKKPLKNLKICFAGDGFEKQELDGMMEKIKLYGGSVRAKPSQTIALVIATSDDLQNDGSKQFANYKNYKIPLVSKEFFNRIGEAMLVSEEIQNTLLPICDWIKPNEVVAGLLRLNPEFEKPQSKEENKGAFELGTDTKVKLLMKDGAVVDPESGLEKKGRVLKYESRFYNAVLNRTDIDSGVNSYYKLQVIEADRKDRYWVFRSWGRIGTTIGGTLVSDPCTKDEALDLFNQLFTDKTQNIFGKKFVKKPGGYLPMDIDYCNEETYAKLVPNETESKLPLPVQELICLLFDVDNMKSALLEFEIDLNRMPLGKLSRAQIMSAYTVLNMALENAAAKEVNERLMTDYTNRFYTLIPQNFGTRMPTLIKTEADIKAKLEMLEALVEIEVGFELLCESKSDKNQSISLIDKHCAKLKTDLTVLETNSKEFGVIKKYLVNTHASTHTSFTLDIEQIFKVNRIGEANRYEKFNDMKNRKLLWHGSRTTNYIGILSQGLRVAPPEAPVTGYMFGKGIYFADMVSKSANYCYTSASKTTGILLLCEVALGEMYEVKSAKENLLKAPNKFDSVKGLGQTHPDPKEKIAFSNGVEVPYGKPVASNVDRSELLYNEYIVYDPAQVKIRYLLKCNFKYGGRKR